MEIGYKADIFHPPHYQNVAIQLTHPQCFSAEIYALDAGLPVSPTSVEKVNMGGHMLRSLFDAWFTAKLKEEAKAKREAEENEQQKQSDMETQPPNSTDGASPIAKLALKEGAYQEPTRPYSKPLSPFLLPSLTALIISDEGIVTPL